MITEKDLQEAIAECEGTRNPNANTCIKLAAFYTIRQHMFPTEQDEPTYSFSPNPTPAVEGDIYYDGDSDFAQRIDGMAQKDVWPVIDELMDTLRVMMPRLYDGVMMKL